MKETRKIREYLKWDGRWEIVGCYILPLEWGLINDGRGLIKKKDFIEVVGYSIGK